MSGVVQLALATAVAVGAFWACDTFLTTKHVTHRMFTPEELARYNGAPQLLLPPGRCRCAGVPVVELVLVVRVRGRRGADGLVVELVLVLVLVQMKVLLLVLLLLEVALSPPPPPLPPLVLLLLPPAAAAAPATAAAWSLGWNEKVCRGGGDMMRGDALGDVCHALQGSQFVLCGRHH
jgi:hypothetical protein